MRTLDQNESSRQVHSEIVTKAVLYVLYVFTNFVM